MALYDRPLPKPITDAMFDRWEAVIQRKECVSIPDVPCSNRQYRINQFIQERSRLTPKILYVPVVIQSFQTEQWQIIESRLEEYRSRKFDQTVFFIIDGEWMIRSMSAEFGQVQQYLMRVGRSVSFLWFIESDILAPLYTSLVTICPSIIQNIIYEQQHEPATVYHFIRHMEGVYGFSLKEKDRREIISVCGGHLWIVSEALRHAHDCGNVSFDHDTMRYRIHRLWDGFSQQEQQVLKNIIRERSILNTHNASLEYLKNLRLVIPKDDSYAITLPILEKYIFNVIVEQHHLTIGDEGQLYINDVCVDRQFVGREIKILKVLLSMPGQIVSRDMLAKALWNDEWEKHYSDWALDQALRRLREKLRRVGLIKPLFQTVKGKGVYVPR
ncbi:MAG: winged helix-turn-helix domain-containing protein [Candidatus Gottesmanbacteria bacterium]|nr:winged helix-turn-helix domain-containing protein [Candidatus Gottesmanbacteria bacterium]